MKVLRLAEVMKKTSLSRSMIYKLISEEKFPENIQISTRSVGWIDCEVDLWMENRLKKRDTEQVQTENGEGICL